MPSSGELPWMKIHEFSLDVGSIRDPKELCVHLIKLCKGMTPARIGRTLSLSLPTVYKHLANIHARLDVSNRQELLPKLMN